MKIKLSQLKLFDGCNNRSEIDALSKRNSLPVKRTRKSNYQTNVGKNRRRQILQAAKTLCELKAVEEISLKDVASEAGIPLTSIYNLFTNLNAVHAEIVKDLWAELLDYRKNHLKPTYSDFCDMVGHSTQINIEFIRQNTLIKKILYSEYIPAIIKSTDTDLLQKNIREFVSTHFTHTQKDELNVLCEKFRKGIVCFDALVSDCISRNGNISRKDESEIIEIIVKLSK